MVLWWYKIRKFLFLIFFAHLISKASAWILLPGRIRFLFGHIRVFQPTWELLFKSASTKQIQIRVHEMIRGRWIRTKERACGGNNAQFLAAWEFFLHTPHRKLIWTIKQSASVPSSASIFLFCLIEFVYTSAPGSCLPTLVLQCQ